MTRDAADTPNWDVSTEAEFDEVLHTVLLTALENDLDPRGAWEYQTGQNYPDLEVLVTELS